MSVTMYVCITYTHRSNHQVSHNKPISRIIGLLVVKPIRNWTSTYIRTHTPCFPANQRWQINARKQSKPHLHVCSKTNQNISRRNLHLSSKNLYLPYKTVLQISFATAQCRKTKTKVIVNDRARNEPRSPRHTSPCAPYSRHKFSDRNGTARHQISFPIL